MLSHFTLAYFLKFLLENMDSDLHQLINQNTSINTCTFCLCIYFLLRYNNTECRKSCINIYVKMLQMI